MKKVVVAMSGGVDSSVAAALLKEQGYDIYGVTMKLSDWQDTEGRKFGGCCGSKDFYDARSVAQTLGIPHYSFDYVEKFKGSVIGYFKDSYMKGETPNPCIACNKHVKFDALLEKAVALGADYVATGHYARSDKKGAYYSLKKAVDAGKDQSYVLYNLGQKQLSRLMFPLGELTKAETRDIARRAGLRTADKPDSYEICFVPNEDYRQFISEEVSANDRPSGPIRHVDGRILGKHKGLPFYTIGQREGLGVTIGSPLYVAALETATNTLVVGPKESVLHPSCLVREMTWVSGVAPTFPLHAEVKIRSRHTPAAATLSRTEEGHVAVTFVEAQSAMTPGQAAVFYQGDEVIGGGVIHRVS
jgi:tRNA-uridine 2-sulfurtransferase